VKDILSLQSGVEDKYVDVRVDLRSGKGCEGGSLLDDNLLWSIIAGTIGVHRRKYRLLCTRTRPLDVLT